MTQLTYLRNHEVSGEREEWQLSCLIRKCKKLFISHQWLSAEILLKKMQKPLSSTTDCGLQLWPYDFFYSDFSSKGRPLLWRSSRFLLKQGQQCFGTSSLGNNSNFTGKGLQSLAGQWQSLGTTYDNGTKQPPKHLQFAGAPPEHFTHRAVLSTSGTEFSPVSL